MQYPFGEKVQRLIQKDRSAKHVFVLGVYASAVHAKWKKGNKVICQALAVASEPRIFWDGNPEEAKQIIDGIKIPAELGELIPASSQLNGPSAKVLDKQILAPLGFTRNDAWLCDLLPETRINPSQEKAIRERYTPLIEKYNLNPVTIPKRPTVFCDEERAAEITDELMESQAPLLVLLGDIPISQYLNRVTDIDFSSLQEFTERYGYGNTFSVQIRDKVIKVLPLAHPRQIGALGTHNEKWYLLHKEWEINRLNEK